MPEGLFMDGVDLRIGARRRAGHRHGLSAHDAPGRHAGGERGLEDQHAIDQGAAIGIGDIEAAGGIEGDRRRGGKLVQGLQAGRCLRQIGLPGNEVELADFEIGADGGGEAAPGDIGGRIAQHAVVAGIGQPEIVLRVEGDGRGEDVAGASAMFFSVGCPAGVVGDARY